MTIWSLTVYTGPSADSSGTTHSDWHALPVALRDMLAEYQRGAWEPRRDGFQCAWAM